MPNLEGRIVIIGANGMLGHALQNTFTGSVLLDKFPTGDIQYADITDFNGLQQTITKLSPIRYLINTAAFTNVDGAETGEGLELSQKINVNGPENLAKLSLELGFDILHFSTAYVFDGEKGSYQENDTTNPLSSYGKHKLDGERPILRAGGTVLRTDALYGSHGGNFVDTMKRLAEQRDSIEVVNDQIGSPTLTSDLAQMAKAVLLNHGNSGNGVVYHAVNEGACSRADLAREIVRNLGLSCNIINVSTQYYNTKNREGIPTAERPRDCSLNTNKLSSLYKPRQWDAALAEYVRASNK